MAHSRNHGMPRASLCLIALIVITLGAPSGGDASTAAKPTVVKAEVLMSGPPATMLPAGDDPAHVVGMGKRRGKASFSDGRKAEYSNVFFVDSFRGKFANVWGYTKMAFPDGSWIFFKWESAFAGRDKAGKPTFAGTGKLLQGTGPYKGIQGSVKFKNQQVPPGRELPKGGTRAQAEITYTLPAK